MKKLHFGGLLLFLFLTLSAVPALADAKGLGANTEYTFQTVDGKSVSTKSDGERATVLIFGRTTCGNCRAVTSSVAKSSWAKKKDIRVLFADADCASADDVKAFAAQYGSSAVTFCYDTGYDINRAMWSYIRKDASLENSVVLPVVVLIDSQDVIQKIMTGYHTEDEILAEINKFAAAPQKPRVPVQKIRISAPAGKAAAGKKISLCAEVIPADATEPALAWSSSDSKYATVDQNGVVKTKKAGIGKVVRITARATDGSNVSHTFKIKIVKDSVKSIRLKAASNSVKAGKSIKIRADVKTSGSSACKTLVWTTSDSAYATVNKKGVVKTKKAGKGKTVRITAAAVDGSRKKAVIKIKIK